MQMASDLVGAIIFENKFPINILIDRSKASIKTSVHSPPFSQNLTP